MNQVSRMKDADPARPGPETGQELWPGAELPAFDSAIFAPRATRYLLVIPVINEGERIQGQLRQLHALRIPLDVAIADGGSTDGSLEAGFLQECGVRALLTRRGPGRLSAQLRMAYAWGLAEGYDGILTVDGNGKDGLEALPRFIDALEAGFDYVQGSRYRKGGAAINTPLDRKIGGRLLHAPLLSLASGHRLTDTTNGFRAYSRRYLADPRVAPFRDCFRDYSLLFYLSARAGQLGYRVTEVPVRRAYPASGPTPTKMGSTGAKMALMGELFRSALGGYHPPAARGLAGIGAPEAGGDAGPVPRFWPWILPLVFLLILASRLAGILDAPDIWHDEGMLMANLPLPSLAAAFQHLPYFAQAAPPGYLILASGVMALAGEHAVIGLRLLSLAGSLGAAAVLALALRRAGGAMVAPVALALMFLSPFGVRYGIEIKQYAFETLATCLMLAATLRAVRRPDGAGLALLAGAGLGLLLFSFAAPVLFAALAAAAALQLLVEGRLRTDGARRLGLLFAGLLAAAGAWHLGVTKPVTVAQFRYFAFVYDLGYLRLPFIDDGEGITVSSFARIMLGMFDPFYRFASEYHAARPVAVVTTLLLAIGILMPLRRGVLLPAFGLALLIGLPVLSHAGFYPVLYSRHFILMQPILAILLATGLLSVLAWIAGAAGMARPAGTMRLVAGFVILQGGVAMLAGVHQEKQQLSEAVAVIAAHAAEPEPLIYVAPTAQPNMLYVAPGFGTQIGYGPGAFDHDFHKRSKISEIAIDYPREIAAHREIWLLETLVYDPDLGRVAASLKPLAAAFGPCTEMHRSGSSRDLGYTLAYRCRAPD
ncbi:glycosyltransferase family 2 protein [Cereibacter azotoformans]|uniref:glycosyltransferase family 2 protein n=1 Tax=Cereibacter azotoformans TaxID=43057 RepID=UPI001F36001C|nr:glycosyltransferase family 2 protein [Cereibacter azotoformans]